MHEPKKMLYLRTDWMRLGEYLKGTLTLPYDDIEPDYREVQDEEEIEALDPERPLACDTESKRDRSPYCFTYSQEAGTGRLIRAERHDLLAALDGRLQEWRAPILFHNWLYDWPVTEALGLHLPVARVVDTMARVFHLGNLPQGLKALAWRECGMSMMDFDDVVTPHSTELVLRYYRDAYAEDWQKPDPQTVYREKAGLWRLYQPQSMKTKLKRFFTDFKNNPSKDVFAMFEDNWQGHQREIEEKCGPYPGMCISHVPFDEMLAYACRDADALIRVWNIIQHMSSRVRKVPQERWRA